MLAAWLALAACGEAPTEVVVRPELASGWVAEVVNQPERFTARVATHREGWIAFHRNDWLEAVAAGGDPAARAHAELARFYWVLAGANASAWVELDRRWLDRGVDPESGLRHLAASLAVDGGVVEVPLSEGWGADTPATVAERVALHQAVRSGAQPAASLVALATVPVLVEDTALAERRFPDPWMLTTLALTERAAALPPATDTSLFSGRLDGSGQPPALPEPASDALADADACRAKVRAVDAELDAWRTALAGGASPDGRALLDDLRLVESTRARALVDMAVAALESQRPACALALGQLALDHESPRAVGPVNSPTLFAVVASAQLQTGRTREALDAIEPIRAAYPAVATLDETVNTLVVLEGIDRRGDSRE